MPLIRGPPYRLTVPSSATSASTISSLAVAATRSGAAAWNSSQFTPRKLYGLAPRLASTTHGATPWRADDWEAITPCHEFLVYLPRQSDLVRQVGRSAAPPHGLNLLDLHAVG